MKLCRLALEDCLGLGFSEALLPSAGSWGWRAEQSPWKDVISSAPPLSGPLGWGPRAILHALTWTQWALGSGSSWTVRAEPAPPAPPFPGVIWLLSHLPSPMEQGHCAIK